MSVRVNYTMTPELTFELYGEPFVSWGTYSEFRELSATPDADSYAARFQPLTPPPDSDTAFKVTQPLLVQPVAILWIDKKTAARCRECILHSQPMHR